RDVVGGVAEDAEAFHDVVGHEVSVRVSGTAVLVVVVALASVDVVGEGLRNSPGGAVLGDDVCHVVADHATEPAALFAHVGAGILRRVADIHGGGDTEFDRVGVATGGLGGVAHGLDHPLGDVDVSELKYETVTDFAGELQREGPVRCYPHVEFGAARPRELQGRSVVLDRAGIGEFADYVYRLAQGLQRRGCAVGDAHRGVAAADAADGAVAVQLVEGRVEGCGDRPVAGGRVGHHGAHDD